jgi:hypothetical protein
VKRPRNERRIIRDGIEAEQVCWAVVGVLQRIVLLAAEDERPYRGRRTCDDCGGLRADTKAGCDVCRVLQRVADREHVVGEVEWLLGTDRPARIARRLGYRSCEALAKRLQRSGRPDLASHFYTDKVVAA